jgi:hypothetical protein
MFYIKSKTGTVISRGRVIVAGAAACLLLFMLGCQRRNAACESAAILAQFRSHYPALISLSPDGGRVVSYDKSSTHGEGLIVREIATGKILHAMKSTDPLKRINWRPDGRAISYFRQESGANRRRLFIWELDSEEHTEVQIPESFAQAIVCWSPNGKRLAYTCDQVGLVILEPGKGAIARYEEQVRAFDWSPDGTSIAAIPSKQSSALVFLDPATGKTTRTLPGSNYIQLRRVAWQDATKLLAVASGNGPSEFEAKGRLIVSLEPQTQRRKVLFSTAAEISELRSLPGGKDFLWNERDANGLEKMFVSATSPVVPRSIPLEFSAHWRGFQPDGMYVVVMEDSSSVRRLVRADMYGSRPALVLAADRPANIGAVEHKFVEVRRSDGTMGAILVSKATEAGRRANAVFIRAHGGYVQWGEERWAETQLYLEHGVDVIQVQRSGGSDINQEKDVIAACDYARTVLGVTRERTVVLAASTPAGAVLHAAQRHPEKMGIIAIIGLYKEPLGLPPSTGSASLRVLGFHGGDDLGVPPAAARSLLEEAFGKGALEPLRGVWHVFAGESHTLARDESHAVIHATILHQLGLIECE